MVAWSSRDALETTILLSDGACARADWQDLSRGGAVTWVGIFDQDMCEMCTLVHLNNVFLSHSSVLLPAMLMLTAGTTFLSCSWVRSYYGYCTCRTKHLFLLILIKLLKCYCLLDTADLLNTKAHTNSCIHHSRV